MTHPADDDAENDDEGERQENDNDGVPGDTIREGGTRT